MKEFEIKFYGKAAGKAQQYLYTGMRTGGLRDIETFLTRFKDTLEIYDYAYVDFETFGDVEQYFSGVKVRITGDLTLVIPGHVFGLSQEELFCLTVEGIEQLIREYKK